MDIIVEKNKNCISFKYKFEGNTFEHILETPQECEPLDDSLFRISLLARPQNANEYTINGITAEQSSKIFFEQQLKCKINIPLGETLEEKSQSILAVAPSDINLSFSGGFDSIASLSVTGPLTKLISHDFGGAFEREALFFKKFGGSVFKWHLRGNRPNQSIKFNESIDWRFMLAPLMCFREKNKPYIISTGTILEASPFWYSGKKRPDFKAYGNFGFGPNVAVINPVSAISEYATTKLAYEYLSPDMLTESLDSLAAKGTLKRYRKEVLVSLIRGLDIPTSSENMPKHIFGRGFTDDILTMYLVWKLGHQWVKENYCMNVPFYASYLDMSFFEKINTFNLSTFDPIMGNELLQTFLKKGLSSFDDNDAERLETSIKFRADFLSENHH